MRIVYLGTPSDAVPALRALHVAGHEVALVVSQPDRRRGRGSATIPTPVKAAALELGLPVITPQRVGDAQDEIAATDAEVGVVVAFGQLLPSPLLAALPLGFVNLHFSLLPRWRGAAPVERAILAGDEETGVCVMALEAGLDTGPVYQTSRTSIGETETAGELHQRLTALGTPLLLETLPVLSDRVPSPQVGEPTHAEKLTVDEFRLDVGQSSESLARAVRAGNPRPGAWLMVDGQRLKVWRAHIEGRTSTRAPGTIEWPSTLVTAAGCLALDEVQAEGKRPTTGRSWMNGTRQRVITIDPT